MDYYINFFKFFFLDILECLPHECSIWGVMKLRVCHWVGFDQAGEFERDFSVSERISEAFF